MEQTIKRVIDNLYPELAARQHLPRFAQVVAMREPVNQGDIVNDYRPRYAVSLQMLDEHGEPDTSYPVLHDVPLALPVAGQESGIFAYPEPGAHCEVAFAYGSPNKPFVRSILPHGLSLPAIKPGEQLQQHSPGSYQRVDQDGNRETYTDGTLSEDALKRIVEAVECLERYTKHEVTVDADSIETIGAAKIIKAMGMLSLLSGSRLDIGALGDLNLTSKTQQAHRAPQSWIGSNDQNLFELVSQLMQLVADLCDVLSSHTHPDAGVINQSAEVAAIGGDVGDVKAVVDGIKL